MLNKPSVSIASRSAAVKNLTRAIALSACLGMVGFASAAQASSPLFVERVIKVKIKMSDLATESGTIAVYDRLKTKAERECEADKSTLFYKSQTIDECVEDLLVQFVKSSKIESLQNYHLLQSPAGTQTLAMNGTLSLEN